MKLRPFSAATEDEAMAQVRRELGEDAIIVSTHRSEHGRGVQILAAREEIDENHFRPGAVFDEGDLLYERLTYHDVSERNVYRLVRQAVRSGLDDPTRKLGMALSEYLDFSPIAAPARGMKILVGPPGVGKTSAVAKLAARSVLNEESILVATTDLVRPGAITQLQALTAAMDLDLLSISNTEKLRVIANTADKDLALYLDTPGINPFNRSEVENIAETIAAADAEPILVINAGRDRTELADTIEVFQSLGCVRVILTGLDCIRRLGTIVDIAIDQDLALAEISLSASIVEGLLSLNEIRLSRLLLHDPNAQHNLAVAEGNNITPLKPKATYA